MRAVAGLARARARRRPPRRGGDQRHADRRPESRSASSLAIAVSRRWRSLLDAAIGLAAALAADARVAAAGARRPDASRSGTRRGRRSRARWRRSASSSGRTGCSSGCPIAGHDRRGPPHAGARGPRRRAGSRPHQSSSSRPRRTSTRGRIFISLIPAWPAYALLVAAIPALVPTLVARLGQQLEPRTAVTDVQTSAAAVSVALLAALPLVLVVLSGR